jgi:hypothetical protein
MTLTAFVLYGVIMFVSTLLGAGLGALIGFYAVIEICVRWMPQ